MVDEAGWKVWLITGCSSGFGRRLVASAIARGDRVIATGRILENIQIIASPNLYLLQLDVTAGFETIKARVDEAVNIWGKIDVVVNNAGVGVLGLLQEGGSSLLEKQFKTNVIGVLDVTNAVLPHLQARKSGTIVMMGSRSAYRTEVPGLGFYCASKAVVHTLGETLSAELASFGIKVLIVEPGAFRTEGIYREVYYTANEIPENDAVRAASMKSFASVPGLQKGDPDKAMEAVVDVVRGEGAAKGRSWPLYLALGDDAEEGIKDKCERLLKHLDEWKDITRSTSFDA